MPPLLRRFLPLPCLVIGGFGGRPQRLLSCPHSARARVLHVAAVAEDLSLQNFISKKHVKQLKQQIKHQACIILRSWCEQDQFGTHSQLWMFQSLGDRKSM